MDLHFTRIRILVYCIRKNVQTKVLGAVDLNMLCILPKVSHFHKIDFKINECRTC
jgi:hypothetical protein